MEAANRDALICDFMETYHIFDIDSIPIGLRATLASGLRDDSRIKMILSGRKYTLIEETLMGVYDVIRWLQWAKTKDGSKNINHPKSIFEIFDDEVKNKAKNENLIIHSESELLRALYGGDN